jgi:hypothetical protein
MSLKSILASVFNRFAYFSKEKLLLILKDLILNCEQQSCMAHLLRKIRKLHAAFPKLRSVRAFYVKFRKILRDDERLQKQREQLGEGVFGRRLKKLHNRLDELVKWENPNAILIDLIKK